MNATPAGGEGGDWAREVFPTPELARMRRLLPLGSARRRGAKLVAGRLADAALSARQAALRAGRGLDRAAAALPRRRVLVLGVYRPDGVADIAAAARELQASRHAVRVVLGATGRAAPGLAEETAATQMRAGKFANVNRLAEAAAPVDDDWVLLLDDDVVLAPRFCDRMLAVAETLDLDLAQPAQSWAGDAAWRVTRRRAALARRTRFVEIGPVTLMRRAVFETLAPFEEAGMGWGMCLHWAALAERNGWQLGIVDALPVRHERRRTGSGYDRDAALAAARRYLETHEHLGYAEADEVLASYRALPGG